jgi:hypothetical protein
VKQINAALTLVISLVILAMYAMLIRQMLESDDRLRFTLKRWWSRAKAWYMIITAHLRAQSTDTMIQHLLRPTDEGEGHAAR